MLAVPKVDDRVNLVEKSREERLCIGFLYHHGNQVFAFLHLLLVGVGLFPTQDVLFVVVAVDNLLQKNWMLKSTYV